MKKYLFVIILFVSSVTVSQQQLHYSFAENPQTLLLNPGAETNYKYHYGIPIFSGFNLSANSKGATLEDLFIDNGESINSLVDRLLPRLQTDDNININLRFDVLYGGYRLNDRDYLSFGFYEEVDFIGYYPKDIAELFYYGNAGNLNRNYSLSHLIGKADVTGVLHVGLSRKINKRLNVGGRFKIYSSSLNVETNNNTGTFITHSNDANILRQNLSNANFSLKTSGLVSNDELLETPEDLYKKTFLGGNLGVGIDLGLTYHFTPQIEFTGSILDIGFIRHSKGVKQYFAKGDYEFDGINFLFDQNNPTDYWKQLQDDFNAKVPNGANEEAYTSWRPTKINAALKYSFGEIRSMKCYTDTHKKYYFNSIGIQYHSVFRPLEIHHSITGFFETSFSEKVHSKLTYTINEYSSTILGSGMSVQLGNVNLYGFIDNLLGMRNLESANTASFNFGINILVK